MKPKSCINSKCSNIFYVPDSQLHLCTMCDKCIEKNEEQSIDKTNPDKYWKELGDIPLDEEGDTDEEFYHFPKGTSPYEIWHWFEEYFDITIGDKYF